MATHEIIESYEVTTGRISEKLHGWNVRAIVCGAIAGFAVAVVMAVLGTALGLTGSAIAADRVVDPESAQRTVAVGTVIWILLSAIVVGFTGGSVLNHLASEDSSYHPTLFAFVTWALGICLAALLGLSALTVADGTPSPLMLNAITARPDPTFSERTSVELSSELERRAKIGAAVAWTVVLGQILGLVATIVAAKLHREKVEIVAVRGGVGEPALRGTS